MTYFQTVVPITLQLLLTFPLAQTPRQGAKHAAISVTVDPPEATVHVGQTQNFTAIVKGTRSTGTRWTVQEQDGGRVTEGGIYTTPRTMGIYHVFATSTESPRTKAVAKVTVVTEYDTKP
jgi:hypothetical protein